MTTQSYLQSYLRPQLRWAFQHYEVAVSRLRAERAQSAKGGFSSWMAGRTRALALAGCCGARPACLGARRAAAAPTGPGARRRAALLCANLGGGAAAERKQTRADSCCVRRHCPLPRPHQPEKACPAILLKRRRSLVVVSLSAFAPPPCDRAAPCALTTAVRI